MKATHYCAYVLIGVLLLLVTGILWAQESMLARTPPMGWNSWNHFACEVSDAVVRAEADALVASGMKSLGYTYILIDDCWQGTRDAEGYIRSNARFSDMKALAEYVHSKTLKIGIYSSPGPKTCGGYEGSYGHEEQDAQTYAAWGMDYLKYDLCSYDGMGDQVAAYKKMGEALKKTGRPMIYALCQYGMQEGWQWGASVGGNLWRTDDDIRDDYYVMAELGFGQNGLEQFAGPGHWNDPDMLEIGNGGMTTDEYRTHMTLWCILAAPLITGNDLAAMDAETRDLLTNPEVIGIDQDPLGVQGRRIKQEGPLEVWMKPLKDGSAAVGLFNRGWGAMPVTVDFRDVGFGASAVVRDLWEKKDLGPFQKKYTAIVPQHGAVMLQVKRGA
ncbi:MAG: glycoside hydrolase family 27 protein [Candidatus Sulfotelmatobacter sp.]